jgi:hypothetical protein
MTPITPRRRVRGSNATSFARTLLVTFHRALVTYPQHFPRPQFHERDRRIARSDPGSVAATTGNDPGLNKELAQRRTVAQMDSRSRFVSSLFRAAALASSVLGTSCAAHHY